MQQKYVNLQNIGHTLFTIRQNIFVFHGLMIGVNVTYVGLIMSSLIPYSVELPTAGQFFMLSLFFSFVVECLFEYYAQKVRIRVRKINNYTEQLRTLQEVAPKEAAYLEGPIYTV